MKQNPTSPIQLKTMTPSLLITIALAFACFALPPAPNAFGVVPAPDGGYPGFNTAEGQNALLHLTTGTANTAVGWVSLENVTTGSFNTGVGAGTLVLNGGDQNTATGAAALLLNTTGSFNTANGALALLNNTEGIYNTATGYHALYSTTTGGGNTADGYRALSQNTTGHQNTAIGNFALFQNQTGGNNTAVGNQAGSNVTTASNVICIGSVPGLNVSNTCFIGNIWGVTTAINNALPVVVSGAGQLGTVSSSLRFKKEIKPMEKVSEALLGLKPVTFQYKSDNTGTPQFGLIAEEVAKVNPDLVVRDENGEIYTVRYDAVNAMLLNEFLKEHRKVQEQEATIAQLKANDAAQLKEIKALAATLKEQASQIQKVSAQVELQKTTPQTVLNNQ
jgi:hypothetical protein